MTRAMLDLRRTDVKCCHQRIWFVLDRATRKKKISAMCFIVVYLHT